MINSFPLKMIYKSYSHLASQEVDVYSIQVVGKETFAVCWFKSREMWDTVSIRELTPLKDKKLNS